MKEKTKQLIEKLKAVASSSPVIVIAIALLEHALAELRRRAGRTRGEIVGDEQQRTLLMESHWDDEQDQRKGGTQ